MNGTDLKAFIQSFAGCSSYQEILPLARLCKGDDSVNDVQGNTRGGARLRSGTSTYVSAWTCPRILLHSVCAHALTQRVVAYPGFTVKRLVIRAVDVELRNMQYMKMVCRE